jgi:DNA-binding transcriptional ArsR family regulator
MIMDPAKLTAAADEASEFLKSLASPVRLRILCMIIGRECSVGELADAMGVRQSVASQHLALLRKDGLVASRRDGQTIWYSLADERVVRVMELMQTLFCADTSVAAKPKRSRVAASATGLAAQRSTKARSIT